MLDSLSPRQNGRHFPDDIFKWIFLNENVWISIIISLKFVPRGPINNSPTLVQVMSWRRPGDKPLPEPMMVRLPTHICVTRPQWVMDWHSINVCFAVLYMHISLWVIIVISTNWFDTIHFVFRHLNLIYTTAHLSIKWIDVLLKLSVINIPITVGGEWCKHIYPLRCEWAYASVN